MNRVKSLSALTAVMMLLVLAVTRASDRPTQTEAGLAAASAKEGKGQQTSSSPRSTQSGEQIRWQVIAGGGSRGTSTNFILSGTAGQTAVGQGTSTNFGLNQSFWQNFGTVCINCGDANSDDAVDISDAVFLIQYIFAGGPAPGDCGYVFGKGDANGDCAVDISDAVYLIQYIFAGGPAPVCGTGCK